MLLVALLLFDLKSKIELAKVHIEEDNVFIFLFVIFSNLEAQILEHGTIKGAGDEEKPVQSVLNQIPEETLEDIKGGSSYKLDR